MDTGPREKEYAQVFSYLLLHAARLHPIDVRRELARWRGADGTFKLSVDTARSDRGYRLEILVQLAIEYILESGELAGEFQRDPSFRRLAHDALYYPSRQWEAGKDLELGEGVKNGKGAFEQYMFERMVSESRIPKEGEGTWEQRVTERQRRLLWEQLRRLACLLAGGKAARNDDQSWSKLDGAWRSEMRRRRTREGSVMDAASEEFPLLAATDGRYVWQFDRLGLPTGAAIERQAAAPSGDSGWRNDFEFIRKVDQALMDHLGLEFSLARMADVYRLISTAPVYGETLAAARRLESPGGEIRSPEATQRDVQLVGDYRKMLAEHVNCVGAGVFCATVLGPAAATEDFAAARDTVLQALRRFLRLDTRIAGEMELLLEPVCSAIQGRPFPFLSTPLIPNLFKSREFDHWATEAFKVVEQRALEPVRRQPLYEAAVSNGWKAWAARFELNADYVPTADQLVDLLICDAARIGPGALLNWNLTAMPFPDWGRTCAACLVDQTAQPTADAGRRPIRAPGWLLWPCLKTLGFGVEERVALNALATLVKLRGQPDESQTVSREMAILQHSLAAPDKGHRTAIIARDRGSLFSNWAVDAPGAAVIWTGADAGQLAAKLGGTSFGACLRDLFRFDVLAFEEEATDQAAVVEEFVRELSDSSKTLQIIKVFRQRPSPEPKEPYAVNPRSLDDLLEPLAKEPPAARKKAWAK